MTQAAKVTDNWFYYWKTSSSLWKEKLESFPFKEIIVPLYWAFHVEKPNKFDFGLQRPETDLKKIHQIGLELDKKIIFFLPIGPAPIFSHGGIPPHLIGILSQNNQCHAYAVSNKEKIYNKIYSFFDPNVFKEYGSFVKILGEYFNTEKITSDLYGIECGFFNNKKFSSYFNDRSNCFHKSFAKYIEASMEEDLFPGIKSPQEEQQEIRKFTNFIFSLYRKVIQENLNQNWEGEKRVVFLGGSTRDFIRRGITEEDFEYFNEILLGINQEFLPSVALLDLDKDPGLFSKQFKDIVLDSYIPWKFSSSFMEEVNFIPLSFFKIYEEETNSFQKSGLLSFLEENYGNTFTYFSSEQEKCPLLNDGNIFFIPGSKIDKNLYPKILKFFLNGGKVFIDCQGLLPEIKNKFDSFLLENSLKVDKIKYLVSFENVSLGEGRLFFFRGNEFNSVEIEKKKEFWQKVLSNMEISHFHLESIPGIKFFWKIRLASNKDLNFQEIRRLYLYNSENSKKKIKGIFKKNISLIKIEPEPEKKYENQSNKLEIEIPPKNWIFVDFGIWA